MSLRRLVLCSLAGLLFSGAVPSQTQSSASPSSSSSSKRVGKLASRAESSLDAGTVDAKVYRNKGLGLSVEIPAGWVLRTEEMNAREEESVAIVPDTETKPTNSGAAMPNKDGRAALDRTAEGSCPHTGTCAGRVLLAAFSRPPEAAGEGVNSSILIVAESVAAYPGLKEATQYFGPVSEVAKA